MPLSEQALVDDPGYPGFKPEFVQESVFYAPLRKLDAADLDKFWLLEYRWPNGTTPLGMCYFELGITWALQYASKHAPLPPSSGYDMRFAGTHLYGTELPIASQWDMTMRDAQLNEELPGFLDEFHERWRRTGDQLLQASQYFEQWDGAGKTPAQCGALLEDAREYLRWSWQHHFVFMYRLLVNYAGFIDLCTEIGVAHTNIATFLQGFESRITEADRALWQLAEQAREQGVSHYLMNAGTPDATTLVSMRGEGGAAAAWAESFAGYLTQWGWRTETVADPLCAPWVEDPTPPLGNIKAFLQKDESHDFDAAARQAAQRRDSAIAQARDGLSTEELSAFDEALAANTRANFLWWNEDHNFHIDFRSAIPLRKAALALGASLDLADPADAIFCFVPELRELAAGEATWSNFATLIDERKDYYRGWAERRKEMPKFVGEPPEVLNDPILTELDGLNADFLRALRAGADQTTLPGISASPGRASGIARVLHDASQLHTVKPGEILICEGTSPSWTPAFTRIAACATDQGGSLSHAAIASREYGVPCVVAVGVATAHITDGMTVTVDGDAGTVSIEDNDDT